MDLHILNNPNLRPPEEVRVERVAATPSADGQRVHVQIQVTPFRERPNLEITIRSGERTLASASVVGIMNFRVAFTLHLRAEPDPAQPPVVRVALYYDDPAAPQHTLDAPLSAPRA